MKIKKDFYSIISWIIIGIIGAISLATVALLRGEKISSLWFISATICIELIAYRFYSAWIATKILMLDAKKITPAKKFDDGKDFVPTNKWITFGHHFAAIAGPGPLIGPTLASQFGYLPSTLWILIGCVLGGAVQDMVILFSSIRRDGKSLGQMIKDEMGPIAGFFAGIGTFAIIIILISVLGLIVVKSLMHSPWGSFTVLMTIPIAMIIGIYLQHIRPSGIVEASIVGVALFLIAVYGGKLINENSHLSTLFNLDAKFLAFAIMIYGFAAATLPVWLLLTPRDYLSSFLKIGTILLLTFAILILQPDIKMPAITRFVDGSGPIFSGKIFPFLFITIACGAISGFHSLVASGTTPKMISNEKDVRLIGYGSMLLEGFVAIIAMIAACSLEPGIFFAINSPAAVVGAKTQAAVETINSWGFAITAEKMEHLAQEMGEETLLARTGGAPSLAVGMANIFASAFGNKLLSIWYHFAIMFEAIFILTTLDAGTRVARFMLQDLTGFKKAKFVIPASFIVVFLWGYFLYMGIIDPSGGVNILWPIFGMSNQMLAGIALSLATVILYKSKNKKYTFITILPLLFILITTSSAAYQKIFSDDIKIGFFALANASQAKLDAGLITGEENIATIKKTIFNQKILAFLAISFTAILWIVACSTTLRIIPQLHMIKNYLNGDFAYKKYLEHHKKNHPNQKPLSKNDFLRHRSKHKWDKVNRCC